MPISEVSGLTADGIHFRRIMAATNAMRAMLESDTYEMNIYSTSKREARDLFEIAVEMINQMGLTNRRVTHDNGVLTIGLIRNVGLVIKEAPTRPPLTVPPLDDFRASDARSRWTSSTVAYQLETEKQERHRLRHARVSYTKAPRINYKKREKFHHHHF